MSLLTIYIVEKPTNPLFIMDSAGYNDPFCLIYVPSLPISLHGQELMISRE